MTLQKQNVPIDFSGLLDTKTGPKHVLPGNFTVLQNAYRKKGKMFAKRPGSDSLAAGAGSPSAKGVVEYNGQLVKFEDDKLKVYIKSLNTWLDRGTLISCIAKPQTMARNTYGYYNSDSATNGGYTVFAYDEGYQKPLKYSLYDENSKSFVVYDTQLQAVGGHPRCIACGSYLYIFFINASGEVRRHEIDTSNPTAVTGGSTVYASGLDDSTPTFDIAVLPDNATIVMLYANENPTNTVTVKTLNHGTATVNSVTYSSERTLGPAAELIVTSTKVMALWSKYGNGANEELRAAVVNHSMATQVAPFTVASESPNFLYNAVTGLTNAAETEARLFFDVGGSAHGVKTATVTFAGSPSSVTQLFNRTDISSKTFKRTVNGTEWFYCIVQKSDTSLQPSYFVVRHDGHVVTPFKYGLAFGTRDNPNSRVTEISAGKFSVALAFREKIFANTGGINSIPSVGRVTLDFADPNPFSVKQLGANLLIAGGKVSMYDGAQVVEQGFHLFPENITFSEVAGGSLDQTKKYQWVVVYEWIDNNGLVHRSAPSVPMTHTASNATYQLDVTVPRPNFTAKKNVAAILYRTEGNGTVFYRVSAQELTQTSGEIAGTAIRDNVADSNLIANELLYTSGGIYENIGPPNGKHVQAYADRAILSDTETGEIWFSKQINQTKPIQFSDLLTLSIAEGGPSIATGVIDDKLIIFKEDSEPYYTFGEGIDDTGAGTAFAAPQKLNVDVSLKDPLSLVNIPNEGLAFKTKQGIYQISRALQSFYFGAEVDDWNSNTIVGAEVDESKSWVYFLTKEGPSLIYDYSEKQWYVFTLSGVGCTMYKGTLSSDKKVFAYIKADGTVHIGNDSVFKDGSSHYIMKAVTGWLHLAGLGGFQRIWRCFFNGEYKDGHDLNINIGYDYKPEYDSLATFEAYTLDGTPYRIQSHLKTQKCEAIRFSIEENSDGATSLTRIKQTETDAGGSGLGANASSAIGQTFLATATGDIHEITLDLYGDVPLTGNIALTMYNTSGGIPSGSAIGTSNNVDAATLSLTAQSITFTFATPIPIVDGTTYAFALFGTHSGGTLRIKAKFSNVYSGGSRVFTSNGGSSWSSQTEDLKFNIKVLGVAKGEALEMDAITLEVGIKRGQAKLQAAQKVAAS